MDLKEINSLLQKYYEGIATESEEVILKDFFAQDQIPSELEEEKTWFNYLSNRQNESDVPVDLKQKIEKLIDSEEERGGRGRLIQMIAMVSGIAASVILILTLLLWEGRKPLEVEAFVYKDTFEDPAEAYENVKSTLQKISGIMNESTEDLTHLSSIHKGMKKMKLVDEHMNDFKSKNQKK